MVFGLVSGWLAVAVCCFLAIHSINRLAEDFYEHADHSCEHPRTHEMPAACSVPFVRARTRQFQVYAFWNEGGSSGRPYRFSVNALSGRPFLVGWVQKGND